MGSSLKAEFLNAGKNKISGEYIQKTVGEMDEAVNYSVEPGEKLNVDMSLTGFCYYTFTIHEEGEDGSTNYLEVRSIADFLLLQQFLEKNYSLKLNSGRPNYKDFK